MIKKEIFKKIKEAHKKYVDWWLPIDVAADSVMAPMSCHRFCETLLTYEEKYWWNRWLPDCVDSKEKYNMKCKILSLIIQHYSGKLNLNENKN